MNILVTGAAGFIGMHIAKELIKRGNCVIGVDNMNSYYDPILKYKRLNQLSILTADSPEEKVMKNNNASFTFVNDDICNRATLDKLFSEYHFQQVFHLAAQAGVQYSLKNPDSYIHSNIDGFYEILDACRRYQVKHLLFASSSSVYGKNDKYPYTINDQTDHPVSLYAATKKSNELMAYAYAESYGIRTTAMRFFTVYGPWGRPDMAPYIFTDAIIHNKPIYLNNDGKMWRDFTYIDDIVSGILIISDSNYGNGEALYKTYNIGNSNPIPITELVETIEEITGKKSIKILKGLPTGDVLCTYADISQIKQELGWTPKICFRQGMENFIEWYKSYIFKTN